MNPPPFMEDEEAADRMRREFVEAMRPLAQAWEERALEIQRAFLASHSLGFLERHTSVLAEEILELLDAREWSSYTVTVFRLELIGILVDRGRK